MQPERGCVAGGGKVCERVKSEGASERESAEKVERCGSLIRQRGETKGVIMSS